MNARLFTRSPRRRGRAVGDTPRLFGGLEVDEQLDLCRLLDWQVACLLAFENSAGIDADLTERVGKAAESGQARVRMRIMKVS